MLEERLTDDLLERLLAAASPEAYLSHECTCDRELSDYLTELLRDRGMRVSDVIRATGLNGTYTYDLFQGKCKKPGRDKAMKLAFGLGCNLQETQRLLRYAGASELCPKFRRDAVIIWCIEQRKTLIECESELWSLGIRTLSDTDSLK